MNTNNSLNSHTSQAPKPRKFFWGFVCIAILAAGFGSFKLLQALKPQPEQRAQVQLIPAVETTPLAYRNSPLIIAGQGIVGSRSEIGLSSQITGEIISIHPNMVNGGSFAKDEVFLQIDPRSFEANLAEAQANKAVSESNLAFINKQITRLESLTKQGFTPEENLDDAINRRDQALANIKRQDAIMANRRLDLERTSIKAPFSGKILTENVDLGDIVAPGKELARFYADDVLEVVVSLNSDDASFIPNLWTQNISNKAKATISVIHGNRNYQWDGYLDRVEADLDQTTRTIDAVVRIPNPNTAGELIAANSIKSTVEKEAPPLMIGMYSSVSIEGMTLANHFVLPIGALHNGNTIWIADSENHLRIETVEVVKEEGNLAVLLAPQLKTGTKIITSNIALVSDGMRIRIEEPSQGGPEQ